MLYEIRKIRKGPSYGLEPDRCVYLEAIII